MGTNPRTQRKAEALRCLRELASVPTNELVALASHFDEVDYGKGSVLMREGDIGQRAFVILDGVASVSRRGEVFAIRGWGDVVGEVALIDGEHRSATVTALSPLRTLAASRRDFEKFSEQPSAGRAIARALCGRMRSMQPA